MGVRSTRSRSNGKMINYESNRTLGNVGTNWVQRYKFQYTYSQSGGTPGTFSATAGEKYLIFGVAPGGTAGTSGEGPGATAGAGGGAAQVSGYFWTAPASGTVTVTTTQGSDVTLVLPTASPTTVFSLNRGQNAGPQYTNIGVGGSVGTYGSHAGGNGGQGGTRQPTYGDPANSGSSALGGAGGGGAGSFWANYGGGQWGRSGAGNGGPSNTQSSIPSIFDPTAGYSVNVLLQDGSTGFQISGTGGGFGGEPTQVPTGQSVPAIPGPPWSAPNSGASGGGGGGGGGLRFTSTSPTLGNAFGGGGGAGPSAPTTGAPGFIIIFQLQSAAV